MSDRAKKTPQDGTSAPEGTRQEASLETKKTRKRWPVVVGIVAVVLVVAGVGFNAWHEQPTFCNAICHSPMDSHVEQYYSEDETVLVTPHAQASIDCLDCHVPTMSEQVSEAAAWIQGDFSDPIESKSSEIATRDFCLRCHDDGNESTGMDWDDIVASTANYGGDIGVNPHASHIGNMDCGSCHKVHDQSEMYCNQCHHLDMPDGWTSTQAGN